MLGSIVLLRVRPKTIISDNAKVRTSAAVLSGAGDAWALHYAS